MKVHVCLGLFEFGLLSLFCWATFLDALFVRPSTNVISFLVVVASYR
jgi:hypothetical protein